ncbi:hypothetical protein LK09_00800 [Microbacterium mangrovi]|uniref:Uncharacterized protein n=1 Tax=Microbacterium mangrovi TaxID=1348253 RepID=A0A0B2ADX0_9MICO|nr:hypothetical protein [Microbacterium mangrovi]KHK99905.1 hypothetical protein LK09_00800 [Microbacterium mangrovi]
MNDASHDRGPQRSMQEDAVVFRAELVRSARAGSTWVAAGIIAAITIGLAVVVAQAVTGAAVPAMQVVFALVKPAMIGAGICGAISVGRTPGALAVGSPSSRPGAHVAAGAAFGTAVFVLSAATYAGSVLVVSPILTDKGIGLDAGSFGATWLPVFAAALSTALLGVLGRAIGSVLPSRRTAVITTVGLLFVLPLTVDLGYLLAARQQWIYDLTAVLPLAVAKNVVFADEPGTAQLPSVVALCTLVAWVLAAATFAWLRSRAVESRTAQTPR